jgi:hypothetical protein
VGDMFWVVIEIGFFVCVASCLNSGSGTVHAGVSLLLLWWWCSVVSLVVCVVVVVCIGGMLLLLLWRTSFVVMHYYCGWISIRVGVNDGVIRARGVRECSPERSLPAVAAMGCCH